MAFSDLKLLGLSDPRLAAHASSATPAWLWSTDGGRLLWANPVGAQSLGYQSAATELSFGPADPRRRQVAQLAERLASAGAVRLERMRGFGGLPGALLTCACTQFELPNGDVAILIVATELQGRGLSLDERLRRLIENTDAPLAAFTRDGRLVATTAAAHSVAASLSGVLDKARTEALQQGQATATTPFREATLYRVGRGSDVGLIAHFALPPDKVLSTPEPVAPQIGSATEPVNTKRSAPPPVPTDPDIRPNEQPSNYEAPDLSDEAPAEFALLEDLDDEVPKGNVAANDDNAPSTERIERIERSDEPAEAAPPLSIAVEPVANLTFSPSQPRPIAPAEHSLRFVWRMDEDGRFSLGSDEFIDLIGARMASAFGRPWREITSAFGIDPEERVARAVATQEAWSGIVLDWPVDGGERLRVELSGLPIFDHLSQFVGYRGFGICHDLEALGRVAALRGDDHESPAPAPLSADVLQAGPASDIPEEEILQTPPIPFEADPQPETLAPMTISENVVPFPTLTSIENSAFHELARQLSARLENERANAAFADAARTASELSELERESTGTTSTEPEDQSRPDAPAAASGVSDRQILDLLPTGVLIYRHGQPIYANPAFLVQANHPSLQALQEAGGLDALRINSTVDREHTAAPGTMIEMPLSQQSIQAKLSEIVWDGEPATLLVCATSGPKAETAEKIETAIPNEPSSIGHTYAEDLAEILDTTADGILMFNAAGAISAINRSAAALFGQTSTDLSQRNFTELFAPESKDVVLDYLGAVKQGDLAGMQQNGREVLGHVHGGGFIPLAITIGRTRQGGPNFFAVFRDLSPSQRSQSELSEARQQVEQAASARADLLQQIDSDVRAPINAIIGFADVMIGERFGQLGHERYAEYIRDVRAAAGRIKVVLNEQLDLSRVQAGKLELVPSQHDLNQLVERCVAALQPQANRERIIIRSSLMHEPAPVTADSKALYQILFGLITNAINLAKAGGQVIVSTASSDAGDMVFRVRDTGLPAGEIAPHIDLPKAPGSKLEMFERAGINLPLIKALIEANHLHFQVRTTPHAGTLVEVTFPRVSASA